MNTLPAYQGGLAFGMTSCDPIHLRPDQLPDDSDLLLDRGEYWVVAKDIATSPGNQEELAFHIDDDGELVVECLGGGGGNECSIPGSGLTRKNRGTF